MAKKNEIVVAPTFFFDTVRVIARSPWLCGFNVADFTDVEVVVLYDLVLASKICTNIPGPRDQGPNC